jgi:uncharacterized protein
MLHIRQLIWNPGNIAHLARHAVTVDEAEEVCHGDPVSLQSYAYRIVLIGPTQAARMLAVILEPVGDDVYFPVTARPASRKERRYYDQQKGGAQP